MFFPGDVYLCATTVECLKTRFRDVRTCGFKISTVVSFAALKFVILNIYKQRALIFFRACLCLSVMWIEAENRFVVSEALAIESLAEGIGSSLKRKFTQKEKFCGNVFSLVLFKICLWLRDWKTKVVWFCVHTIQVL